MRDKKKYREVIPVVFRAHGLLPILFNKNLKKDFANFNENTKWNVRRKLGITWQKNLTTAELVLHLQNK